MVIRIVLSLVFVGAIALYNYLLVDVRFEELYSLLGSAAAREEALTAFGILSRYETMKSGVTAEDNPCSVDYGPEMKAILSGSPMSGSSTRHDYRLPVRYIVRGVRALIGKRSAAHREDDPIIGVLEIGYFFERSHKYRPALAVYQDVLKTGGVTPAIRAAVMMHAAYCVSMLGNYQEAKQLFEQVISQYSAAGAGALSWKLIDDIQEMEKQREAIEAMLAQPLEKARRFYSRMDFREAVRMYAAAIEEGLPPGPALEIHYCKGRAHEELGQVHDAAGEYRAVRHIDTRSALAKKAQCRLTAMSQYLTQEKAVAGEAQRRLAAYREKRFSERVQAYAEAVSQNLLSSELLGDGGHAPAGDSLRNAVKDIGSVDLTAETSAAEQQKRLDSLRNALVQKGDSGAAGKKQDARQHPYRRPTAVKAVIDAHQKELDALYKKKLRNKAAGLAGGLLVGFTIRANGTVSRVSVIESDLGDQTFEKEVLRCVWGWKFRPVPASVGDFAIRYPFEFP
ncbi:MAG: TonB family protein [Chitinispirillaceae bacterium]|nr:TonB family protein [Chitinispirillaceae bacterium]